MGCATAPAAIPVATKAPAASRATKRQEPDTANFIAITSIRVGSD